MSEEIPIEFYKTNNNKIVKYVRYEELEKKDEEIERLNNIINGMEEFFKYEFEEEVRPLNDFKVSVWTICLDKLQELRNENDKK